jgi:rhamnose utilization protein RhaD (predicted bifunctional aldolase and dehydrogenase)
LSDHKQQVLEELIGMSHRLGEPERELVILGEGNTSAKISDETFFVKASGTQLQTIGPDGFVEVSTQKALDILKEDDPSDERIIELLRQAGVDDSGLVPSVETILHASLLSMDGINFVGHTHPIAANAILCSHNPELLVNGRMFPDDIVCTGPSAVFVPYTDPGVKLSKAVRAGVAGYVEENGFYPKLILMQSHGVIALGKTAKEVETITYMHVKSCKIALGALAVGGINFLTPANVERIFNRPDEKAREAMLFGARKDGYSKEGS